MDEADLQAQQAAAERALTDRTQLAEDARSAVNAVLTDLRTIAVRQGWTDLAAVPQAPGDRSLLLCASPGAATADLIDWLAARIPDDLVRTVPLAALAADPLPALAANRVLLVLDCAELLAADAVAAAAELVARPAAGVRVVLTGAATMAGTDDLARVQRRIWRILYGVPGREWAGEDLAELGCALWDKAPVAEEVADRVAQDGAALDGWLRAPVGPDPALARYRAERLLGLAEGRAETDALRAQRAARLAPAVPPARVRTRVAEIRGHLLGLVQAESAGAATYVTAQLDALDADLTAGLPRFIEAHAAEAAEPADAQRLLDGYLARGTASWATGVGADLRLRAAKINLASQDALAELTALPPAGPSGRRLNPALPTVTMDPPLSAREAAGAPGDPGARGSGPVSLPLGLGVAGFVAGAVLTGGLAAPLAASVGAAIGAGVGGGLGAYAQRRRNDQQADRVLAFATIQVARHMAELRGSMPTGLSRELDGLYQAVESAFVQLEAQLDAAHGAGPTGSDPADRAEQTGDAGRASDADTQLRALRARLAQTDAG